MLSDNLKNFKLESNLIFYKFLNQPFVIGLQLGDESEPSSLRISIISRALLSTLHKFNYNFNKNLITLPTRLVGARIDVNLHIFVFLSKNKNLKI